MEYGAVKLKKMCDRPKWTEGNLKIIKKLLDCILSQGESAIWLGSEFPVEQRLKAIHPVDNLLLKGCQVDPKINNPRNKDENNNDPSGPDLTLFD